MTHVTIMTLSYIVSEIQTDGQAKCIYRYIYIYRVSHKIFDRGYFYIIEKILTLETWMLFHIFDTSFKHIM